MIGRVVIPPNEATAWLERYRAYLDHACPVIHCRARRGEPCRDTPPGTVHESRQAACFARIGGAPLRARAR